MLSPKVLRLRCRLTAKFDQLVARLNDGDPMALVEARDHLQGLALKANCDTMALVFRALGRTLTDMQEEIDGQGLKMDNT
jgi:hypothetical protein